MCVRVFLCSYDNREHWFFRGINSQRVALACEAQLEAQNCAEKNLSKIFTSKIHIYTLLVVQKHRPEAYLRTELNQ